MVDVFPTAEIKSIHNLASRLLLKYESWHRRDGMLRAKVNSDDVSRTWHFGVVGNRLGPLRK
jgi:hypothetical protein